jgi:hypothetical protein
MMRSRELSPHPPKVDIAGGHALTERVRIERHGPCATREALPRMGAVVFDECYVEECNDPPTVEAIVTYDRVFGIEQTLRSLYVAVTLTRCATSS